MRRADVPVRWLDTRASAHCGAPSEAAHYAGAVDRSVRWPPVATISSPSAVGTPSAATRHALPRPDSESQPSASAQDGDSRLHARGGEWIRSRLMLVRCRAVEESIRRVRNTHVVRWCTMPIASVYRTAGSDPVRGARGGPIRVRTSLLRARRPSSASSRCDDGLWHARRDSGRVVIRPDRRRANRRRHRADPRHALDGLIYCGVVGLDVRAKAGCSRCTRGAVHRVASGSAASFSHSG